MEKDTTLRNMVMLQMIPREPEFTTAEKIRDKLDEEGYNISVRAVQRNLIKCSTKFGFTSDRQMDSKTNCWYWSKDVSAWDIPKMNIMTAFAFNLVESFLKRLIPNSILEFMFEHFQRAEYLLNKLEDSKWSHWNEKINIIPRGLQLIPPSIDQSIFEIIFDAVIKEKQIKLNYQKRDADKTKRYHLNPLGLVFNQEVVYLVATKQGKKTVQHFALHRVASAENKHIDAIIPTGFDLKKYIEGGAFQYPLSGEQIHLKVKFEQGIARHLYESELTEDQTLTEQEDGTIQLETNIQNSSALKWWLLGFGDGVEVLEPLELREEFRNTVKNLALKYG